MHMNPKELIKDLTDVATRLDETGPMSHAFYVTQAMIYIDAKQVSPVWQAKREVEHERFRELVEAEKLRIRTHRTLWQQMFPWKITITPRG